MFLACFGAAKCGIARTSPRARAALCEPAMRMQHAVFAIAAACAATVLGCAREPDPPPEYPPLDQSPPVVLPDPAPPAAQQTPQPVQPNTPASLTDAPVTGSDGAPPAATPAPDPAQTPAPAVPK